VLDEAARQLNEKERAADSARGNRGKLGVTRGAMYYYVEDREDLVFQCYRRAAEITARHLLEASRAGGTAADMLRSFVTRMLDPNEPEIAARAEIAMLNATQRDTIQGLYDAPRRVPHVLETGEREALLRRCDVEVSARIILSLVTWAPLAAVGACSRPDGPLAAARSGDRNCLRRLFPARRGCPSFSRSISPHCRRPS
jgi:AcrR family transcriptional regulator